MNLNWKEIARASELIQAEVVGPGHSLVHVDRIIVPERADFPGGYIKGEWCIRLQSRKQEFALLVSVRPRHPYVALIQGKGPRASEQATHSPFEQALSKQIRGVRLLRLEALPRERVVALWFEGGEPGRELGLILSLIPATPEAFLVERRGKTQGDWPILARSRTVRDPAKVLITYQPPDGSKAPPEMAVREEWFKTPFSYAAVLERELKAEAFALRSQGAARAARDLLKQAQDRGRQSEVAIREARAESDWLRFGNLMKAVLHDPPEVVDGMRRLTDFETGEVISVPADPKLTPSEQVEKFYRLAKRRARRIEEAELRLSAFREKAELVSRLLAELPAVGGSAEDWAVLGRVERALGIGVMPSAAGKPGAKAVPKGKAWLGKTFESKDGLRILVGRSRDENLELTFKHARGNDLWMHLRGRPGAHVVIPVSTGKSVPLETLLDAAQLTVHYSRGAGGGKTEVDYTFKKYVKRIKDSTEASYTNNKTLMIQPDPERLKRLLGQE